MKKRVMTIVIAIIMLSTVLTACDTSERPLTVSELLNLGERYLLELNFEQALVQFLRVIEIEPMNPRGYLGAAEAYIGLGETDRAIRILERGLRELPDNAQIMAKLDEIESSGQGTGSNAQTPGSGGSSGTDGAMGEIRTPYGDIMAPRLTVLLRQETMRYNDDMDSLHISEYDRYGYQVGYGDEHSWSTWEYDETAGGWIEGRDGELVDDYPQQLQQGTRAVLETGMGVLASPWPEPMPESYTISSMYMNGEPIPGGRPTRVDVHGRGYSNSWGGWTYATIEYDEWNNVVRITSFNDDGEFGYATLEWAILILQPDGTYIMESR